MDNLLLLLLVIAVIIALYYFVFNQNIFGACFLCPTCGQKTGNAVAPAEGEEENCCGGRRHY